MTNNERINPSFVPPSNDNERIDPLYVQRAYMSSWKTESSSQLAKIFDEESVVTRQRAMMSNFQTFEVNVGEIIEIEMLARRRKDYQLLEVCRDSIRSCEDWARDMVLKGFPEPIHPIVEGFFRDYSGAFHNYSLIRYAQIEEVVGIADEIGLPKQADLAVGSA